MSPNTPRLLLLACALAACSGPRIPEQALQGAPRIGGHTGPAIDGDVAGTNRFAGPLLSIFEAGAAHRTTARLDMVPRPPGSDGYERAIDFLAEELEVAGFGAEPGYGLRVVETAMGRPAWTPIAASLNAVGYTETGALRQRIELAGFDRGDLPERNMLPYGAPSFDVTGTVALELEDVTEGVILLTDRSIRSVEQEAVARGAGGILSTHLLPYAQDPTGQDRHYDAIFTGSVRPGADIPSLYVSPRTGENVRQVLRNGGSFEMKGLSKSEVRPLRTLVAEIEGAEFPDQIVYVITHADGYGANDNAAGAGGMLELCRGVKRLLQSGRIQRPRRTLRFVFGAESSAGKVVLDELDGTPVCAIVADMIGTDYTKTGAICLLERGWDPGAIVPLPPDQHTPWGAGAVMEEDIVPNGLSVVLREALVDVGEATVEKGSPPWPTAEHPWEGGSDHDMFLSAGVPAALVWHFTDFSYATSLDRIDHVDPAELRRTSVAIGAAACAIADARMGDLERHLDSLNLERRMRLGEVERASAGAELENQWKNWFDGARLWIRALCAGDPIPEARTLDTFESED